MVIHNLLRGGSLALLLLLQACGTMTVTSSYSFQTLSIGGLPTDKVATTGARLMQATCPKDASSSATVEVEERNILRTGQVPVARTTVRGGCVGTL